MPDPNQILIPRSFIDLFVPPRSHKPNASREHMAQRYDLCEDMAQMLTERARVRPFELGVAEVGVLDRIYACLSAGMVVDDAEGHWVVRRLAELLEWEPLVFRT